MKVTIFPGKCKGTQRIPPSKSMAHRAIICASLCDGTSTITNIDYSQDILATIQAMRTLGASIQQDGNTLTICGIDPFHPVSSNSIDCKESGSTLRFLIPLFTASNQKMHFTGAKRLLQRPQDIYQDIYHKQGLHFQQNESYIEVQGALHSGSYTIDGNISSQFISGLLFYLPLLKENSILHIKKPFESRSYVDLTIAMLKKFHIQVSYQDETTIYIPGNQRYKACDYEVEGDYSQFAFFACLGAINHDLSLTGLAHDSLQGDREMVNILKRAGVEIQEIEHGYHIKKSAIHSSLIDLSNCPDLGPILCVLGSCATGSTKIIHAERLRIKESDRIEAIETELKKFNVAISSTQDTITIHGASSYETKACIDAHNDHRIVMSIAILSTIAKTPVTILDAQAINKSYPSFFQDLQSLGIPIQIENEKYE